MSYYEGDVVEGLGWYSTLLQILFLLGTVFQFWMLIHAATRQDWTWVVLIFFLNVPAAIWYFFTNYRNGGSGFTGFELPGAQNRRRIRELQSQIHHLDKAHHHLQLGDIYFSQGKFTEAEECYRKALERDSADLDIRSHLGQCLLRQGRAEEALPFLHGVCSENRQHEYGYTLMALAETFAALGRREDSIKVWKSVLERYRYDRARVQLAELCFETGDTAEAERLAADVLADWNHTTPFDKARNRVWQRRARSLHAKLS